MERKNFKGFVVDETKGTAAYASAAYYLTAAEALAAAERRAEAKAAKYGRTYTAKAVEAGHGVVATGRTFEAAP